MHEERLDPNMLTDEEVLNYADKMEDPWVQRLLIIITQLETSLAYAEEEVSVLTSGIDYQ